MNRFAYVLAAAAIALGHAGHAVAADGDNAEADRLLGVLPNYTTVNTPFAPTETTREAFKIASLGSFDPVIYPFIGLTTAVGQGASDRSYTARYGTAFADHTIGNFMTTAVLPSLTREDSRYFRRGEGGVFKRLAYAASRSVVTRTRAGAATFNISKIAGTAVAAGLSNIYYSPADRTVGATATRWASQLMWGTVANELKEFWPDIRAKLRR